MKGIPIELPRPQWEKLCQMVRDGKGYKRIAKAMSLPVSTSYRYVNLYRAGAIIAWPKRKDPREIRLMDIYSLFLSERNIRNDRTIKAYLKCVRLLSRYCIANNRNIEDIVRDDLIKIMKDLKSPSTRKIYTIFYKMFFAWLCYQVCRIPHNPTETLVIPKQDKIQIKIFSDDEIKRIFKACQSPLEYLLVSLFIYTGLRASEVLAIKLAHCDLDRKILYVPYVKGGKSLVKPLPAKLVSEIRKYLSSTKILDEYLLVYPGTYYIPARRGKHISIRVFTDTMNAIFDRTFSGDKKRRKQVSMHKFRHTYVTLNARNVQGSLSERRAFVAHMGWSSEQMLDKYLHIEDDVPELAASHVNKTFDEKDWTGGDNK